MCPVLLIFCALKMHNSSGLSVLLVSVNNIMPSEYGSSSFDDYLNTLGELEVLWTPMHKCDRTVLVGDFDVDLKSWWELGRSTD